MSDENALAQVVTPSMIDQVRAKLKNGMDVEAVCMQLGIANIQAVTSILKTTQEVDWSKKSNTEILEDQKLVLLQLIEGAKYELLADPGNSRLALSVTALMQTLQATITDLENRKDPKKISSEILTKVIQPLVRGLIKSLTIESSKARAAIVAGLNTDHNKIVDFAIKDMMKGFGATASKEYSSSAQAISELLGLDEVKDDKLNNTTTVEVIANVDSPS